MLSPAGEVVLSFEATLACRRGRRDGKCNGRRDGEVETRVMEVARRGSRVVDRQKKGEYKGRQYSTTQSKQ